MGCWNESCMLTHLPIYSGERTYAVVLLEHPLYGNSPCYACHNYTPLFIFEGTYNDYGSLENLSELDVEVLDVLAKMVGFDDPVETFDDLMEELKVKPVLLEFKQYPFIKQFAHRKESQMHVVFLRADAVDHMVSVLPAWYREHSNQIQEEFLQANAPDHVIMQPCLDREESKRFEICIAKIMLSKEISMNHPLNSVASDWIKATASPKTLSRYLLLIKLNYVLQSLRMDWFLPSGTGSQDRITDLHREYAKLLKNAIEKEDREE